MSHLNINKLCPRKKVLKNVYQSCNNLQTIMKEMEEIKQSIKQNRKQNKEEIKQCIEQLEIKIDIMIEDMTKQEISNSK